MIRCANMLLNTVTQRENIMPVWRGGGVETTTDLVMKWGSCNKASNKDDKKPAGRLDSWRARVSLELWVPLEAQYDCPASSSSTTFLSYDKYYYRSVHWVNLPSVTSGINSAIYWRCTPHCQLDSWNRRITREFNRIIRAAYVVLSQERSKTTASTVTTTSYEKPSSGSRCQHWKSQSV